MKEVKSPAIKLSDAARIGLKLYVVQAWTTEKSYEDNKRCDLFVYVTAPGESKAEDKGGDLVNKVDTWVALEAYAVNALPERGLLNTVYSGETGTAVR